MEKLKSYIIVTMDGEIHTGTYHTYSIVDELFYSFRQYKHDYVANLDEAEWLSEYIVKIDSIHHIRLMGRE